ncbi:MAG: hypothetical protein JRJ56_06195 [Deltaproteobacteria bacterium]|nr:hypothetical protein [Deltaproteobacteria bacterium]
MFKPRLVTPLILCLLLAVAGVGAGAARAANFTFTDDFNTLDRSFWLVYNHGGSQGPYSPAYDLAPVSGGILRLPVTVTDHGPELISRPIPITSQSIITASWRIRASYANQYFAGQTGFVLVDYDTDYDPRGQSVPPSRYYDDDAGQVKLQQLAAVYYRNYDYGNYPPPAGGESFGVCAAGSAPASERCLATPAAWNTWVEIKAELDLAAGKLKYWQGGTLMTELPLEPDVDFRQLPYLRLWFSPYGWHTGHELDLDHFSLQVSEKAAVQEADNATFDLQTLVLHVPRLDLSNYGAGCWWLDLQLTTTDFPLNFVLDLDAGLGGLGQRQDGPNGSPAAATLDLDTGILHIPILDLGTDETYRLDLALTTVLDHRYTFTLDLPSGLGGIWVNQENPQPPAPKPETGKTVTLVSPTDTIDQCAYSFARDARESDPNREQYDILVESWCDDRPALCGNFADLGPVDFSKVTTAPAGGYNDNCDYVDPTHVFVSQNRDGSHTVFMITRHVSDNWQGHCRHTIDIQYRQLD